MIYRIVNEARMNQVKELWDYCFEKKDEPFFQYYFQSYCGKDNMVVGGFEEINNWEHLRSMLHINPYMLKIRGQEQLLPYLVGIAVSPEVRGQHQMEPLLQTTFDVLRSQNFSFVMLMPIFAGIYLPYDFAYVCYRHEYDIPLTSLPQIEAGKEYFVERVPLEKTILAPLYEEFMHGRNGVVRTDFQWNKLLAVHALENVCCATASVDGIHKGYMLYRIADGCFTILELVTTDYGARSRLLQYVAGHRSEARRVKWLAEAENTFYLNFVDQSLTGNLYPFMMARCIDARSALEQFPISDAELCGEITVLLTDKLIPLNNHLLKIKAEGGALSVATTAEQEDFAMDMGTFSQLYFGTFTVETLVASGRIRCASSQKTNFLQRLFPLCKNFINEYF